MRRFDAAENKDFVPSDVCLTAHYCGPARPSGRRRAQSKRRSKAEPSSKAEPKAPAEVKTIKVRQAKYTRTVSVSFCSLAGRRNLQQSLLMSVLLLLLCDCVCDVCCVCVCVCVCVFVLFFAWLRRLTCRQVKQHKRLRPHQCSLMTRALTQLWKKRKKMNEHQSHRRPVRLNRRKLALRTKSMILCGTTWVWGATPFCR